MSPMKKHFKRRGKKLPLKKTISKVVKGIEHRHTEVKSFDTQISTAYAIAYNVVNLLALAQGTTDVTRLGNKIELDSIHFHLRINVSTLSATAPFETFLRCILFQDTAGSSVPTNAGAAPATDVLQAVYSSALYNRECEHRFKILKNIMIPIQIGNSTVADGAIPSCIIKRNVIRKMNKFVHFQDTNGTIAPKNGLWLTYGIDSLGGVTPGVVSTLMDVRVKFRDS